MIKWFVYSLIDLRYTLVKCCSSLTSSIPARPASLTDDTGSTSHIAWSKYLISHVVSSTNVDTLGTINDGTWEGTAIESDYVGQLPTSKIASGTMADARIAASNVNQHLVWSYSTGGYKTNNNSTTFYYFPTYTGGNAWTNLDSSPTSITSSDCNSYSFYPKFAGTLTEIHIVIRASDTGATDPVRFYVFKGNSAHNSTSTTLTQIGVTSATTPVALKQAVSNTSISSSNTFAADDKLWIMYKKESTSGNQDLYFSVTISGEYS